MSKAPLLKVNDVAERLGLGVKTIYVLIESGRLPHYKLRQSVRISETQLEEYLARAEKPARQPIEARR